MTISYKPLWMTAVERGITPAELRIRSGLAPATFTRLRKNEPVNIWSLLRCAEVLHCSVEQVVAFREEAGS